MPFEHDGSKAALSSRNKVTSFGVYETPQMSAVPKPYVTPLEYLTREREAETKREYFRGEVFAMPGASRAHNLIAGNTLIAIGPQLRDRECEVYPGDMRVKFACPLASRRPVVQRRCQVGFEGLEVELCVRHQIALLARE